MSTRMQQRRGTAAQWLSTNAGNGPILSPGEIGFESDTNKFKIGDGVNHWIDLAYFVDEDSATGGGGAISVQQVNAAGSPVESYTNITTIQFDEDSGFDVTNPATGTAKIAMNSTFKYWEVDGTQQLTAVGLDTVNFISGTGIDISADGSANPQSLTVSADFTGLATETYVNTAISNLVDGAPGVLDTLNEIAAAINDDASYAANITTSLSNKQDKVTGVSDTEIGYLNGVTSSIQDQLDDKASITGTETLENKTLINPVVTYRELTQSSITMLYANNAAFYEFKDSSGTTFMGPNGQNGWFYPEASHTIYLEDYPDLTTIRIVNSTWNQIFNGTIAQAVSGGYITYDDGSNDYTVSPIELYRLDGVTSNIQSQLNSKASTTNLSDHAANTSTHGVAGSIVGTDSIQTLTNKTLFNPEITVQEVTTPGSLTLKDGYIYTFIKPDDSTYPSPNGQNNLWSSYDAQVVLLSQIPLATRTNVISTTTWNSVGTFTFAQADTQNYLDYQPTITADTAISNIEIKYLDGVTSSIQTQLNNKLETSALAGYATESYVDNAVANSGGGGTTDLSLAAGVGLDWNSTTSQIDIDSTIATKSYVDAVAKGLDVKQSVVVATADFEHIDLATWNANSGVIDNVGVGFNRVLLKNQNTWSENGIYAADPTTGFLVRTDDGIVNTTLTKGSFVFVETGATNAGKGFVVSDIQAWNNDGVRWSLFSASPGLPNQNGNAGKYLTTDGTNPYWSTVSGGGTAAESIHPFAMIG